MSEACDSCGASRPGLPAWTFLVPVIIGGLAVATILVFKGRVSGRILAALVTVGFVGFAAWLGLRLKDLLSARCPQCGRRRE